jgi:hypothetical protein
VNGIAKKKTTLEIIDKLPGESTFLPVQVLGELFHVLVRKAGHSPERARAAILSWQDVFPLIETSRQSCWLRPLWLLIIGSGSGTQWSSLRLPPRDADCSSRKSCRRGSPGTELR